MIDSRSTRRAPAFLVALAALLLASTAAAHAEAPFFSKAFDPATIGPGSVSTLTFTISTTGEDFPTPAADLAFSDTLPSGVTLATPAGPTSTCGGIVSAPDGGTTIDFSGGSVGVGSECRVTVNVTSSMAGTHTNVSGDLTSDQGNSGTASADLTVDAGLPAFSKSFSPSTVAVGHVSRLTFTIDDSAIGSLVSGLLFSDDLPPGLTVASPVNLVNTCGGTVTASPGTSSVRLISGFLLANSSCSLALDVVPTVGGTFDNVTSNLSSSRGSAGKAAAVLNAPVSFLNKTFIDDPAAPGGTVTLEFTMVNLDRANAVTGVSFTDDLDATLSGLVATGLPASDVCGAGSSLTGTSLLTFSGGDLPAGGSCTFDVTLQVPAGAAAGSYTNTTSSVTAAAGGAPVVFPPASDDLIIQPFPILTKTFTDDPVIADGTVTLEFSITNSDPASPITGITFNDDLSPALSGVTLADVTVPPSGFCGGGSTINKLSGGVFPLGDIGILVSGASLAPGDTCTFDLSVHVPADTPPGITTNTTSAIEGTVNAETVVGKSASDDLEVIAPPRLTKAFLGPALPGGTTTLQFTLTYDENAPAGATDIAFTDDLDAVLSGLVAIGLPANDVCGAGSQISGTSTLSFTGGSLAPSSSCTFNVTVQVPAAALPRLVHEHHERRDRHGRRPRDHRRGRHGQPRRRRSRAHQELHRRPGGAGRHRHPPVHAQQREPDRERHQRRLHRRPEHRALRPLPTGLPVNDVCGMGSQLAATGSILVFTGGNLAPGASCTFSVSLTVPAAASPGEYANMTSSVSADVDGNPVTVAPASDSLTVELPLSITKTFLQDAVVAGSTVTLEFVLGNADPSQAATGLTFTDDLDAALSGLIASSTPMNDVCGAGSQLSGTSVLTLTGGSLPAGGSCTFDVTLQVPTGVAAGTVATNVTSDLTGTVGGVATSAPPATDTLSVQGVAFSKSFDAPTGPGGTTTLTFTLENLSTTSGVSGLSFLDDLNAVLPGLVAVGLPASGVCGAGSQLSGTSLLTFTSGSLDPSGSCTFSVTVQVPGGASPGSYPNTTSSLTLGGLMAAAPATANLDLEPSPGFSKSFSPMAIGVGEAVTLTFTVDNSAGSVAATGLDFTDGLPAGMEVADPAGESTTCTGGTITATPGSGTVSYTGGTVGAGAMCTVAVKVTATALGNLVNTSGALTSSLGASGTAASTLNVVPLPVFGKDFAPTAIQVDETTTLTFTIDNSGSSAAADGLGFTDNLPTGMMIADPSQASSTCTGGTITAAPGSSTVSYSGGSVAAGAICTVQVDVVGTAAGGLVNITEMLSSSLGPSAPATATLAVSALPVVEVPTLDPRALALLAALLLVAGAWRLQG